MRIRVLPPWMPAWVPPTFMALVCSAAWIYSFFASSPDAANGVLRPACAAAAAFFTGQVVAEVYVYMKKRRLLRLIRERAGLHIVPNSNQGD